MDKAETPSSEAALADLVKKAALSRRTIKITGGGTRPLGNPVVADKAVITSSITGVSLYEPGALTIVVKAGTTLDEINQTLASENQHLQFEPADYTGLLGTKGKSTIGGVIAAAVSGPRRIQTGAARDGLIGVHFINGTGEIIKNGGRVMKNVTGYDLVKLLCGSYGTLGILTELSFKVLPKPQATGVVLISGLDDKKAVQLLCKSLGSPFDVSGAAHTPNGIDGHPVTMIRVEGFSKSVSYRTKRLAELLAPQLGPTHDIHIETSTKKTAARWQWVRDVEAFHGKQGSVWRISVKPTDGPILVGNIQQTIDAQALYDWGGGLVWLLVPDANGASENLVRRQVNEVGGHATLIRSSDEMRQKIEAFHPQPRRLAEISHQLRVQFDPHGIFNPGLMARQTVGA